MTDLPEHPYPGKPGMTADFAALTDAVAAVDADVTALETLFRVEDRTVTTDVNGDSYIGLPSGYVIAAATPWNTEVDSCSTIGVTYGNKVRFYGAPSRSVTGRFLFVRSTFPNPAGAATQPAADEPLEEEPTE